MYQNKPVSILLICISPLLLADPMVIHNSGKTTPLHSILKHSRYYTAPPEHHQNEFHPLPVMTPSMTPGRVQSRNINRPFLNQAIFIVGADGLSLTWLKEHRQPLKKHNAIGIAVNIKTQQELAQLVQASGGLSINPVVGEKIARQLSLKHYPVLISATRIEQ